MKKPTKISTGLAGKNLKELQAENVRFKRKLMAVNSSLALNRERKLVERVKAENSLFSLVRDVVGQQANVTTFDDILRNNVYAPLTLNFTMLTFLYKTHGIIQAAIDMPVLDALEGGIEISADGQIDDKELREFERELEESGILGTIAEAMIWTRLYGGGALIINTDDGRAGMDQPLTMGQIKGRRIEFYAAARWELSAPWRIADKYQFYSHQINHTRVRTICGKTAPYFIRWQLAGWGMSEVEKILLSFNKFLKTEDVIYDLLGEAKTDVYRFEDFKDSLLNDTGSQAIASRIQLMNQLKTANGAIALDIKDEYDQKQYAFGGLAEMRMQNRSCLAADLRIPEDKLFGRGASGFSSGEDVIENYNRMISAEVRTPMRPVIRDVVNVMFLVKFGFIPHWNFKYKPMRIMGGEAEETIKASKHQRYIEDYDRGLITSEEYGAIAQKEGLTPIPLSIEESEGSREPEAPEGGMFGMKDEAEEKPAAKLKSKSKGAKKK